MRTYPPTPRFRFGRLITPLLLVWLSGVGCLLHCAAICASGAPEAHDAAAARPAEASGEHACCHAPGELDAGDAAGEAPGGLPAARALRGDGATDSCCMLAGRRSIRAPVPDGVDAPVVVARRYAGPLAAAAPPVLPARSLPVLNRGDTHLRCCVFLI